MGLWAFKAKPSPNTEPNPNDLEEFTPGGLTKKTYQVTPADLTNSTPFETDGLVEFVLFLQASPDFYAGGYIGICAQAQKRDLTWFQIPYFYIRDPNSQAELTPTTSWYKGGAGFGWPQNEDVIFPYNISLLISHQLTVGFCDATLYYLSE